MSIFKKAIFWATSIIFMSGATAFAQSSQYNSSAIPNTFPKIALEAPTVSDVSEYKIAAIQFLPEFENNEFGWNGNEIEGNHTKKNCSAYPLSSCPSGSKCSSCPFDRRKFKLNSCVAPYINSGNNCICPPPVTLNNPSETCIKYCDGNCIAKTCTPTPNHSRCTNGTTSCSDNCGGTRQCCIPCTHKITSKPTNSDYTLSTCNNGDGEVMIQTGWTCISGYHANGSICEKDCIVQNCSAYTLDLCPANGVCSKCTRTSSNCSTDGVKWRLDSCNTGYSISGGICVKNTGPKIGDILYSDMTTSDQVISGKTPIGVVFDAERKRAIGLKAQKLSLLSNHDDIRDIPVYEERDYDGKINTQIIRNLCTKSSYSCYSSSLSAMTFVNNYTTAGTFAGDWYIPALGETYDIYQNMTKLNQTINLISGEKLTDYAYQSSSRANNDAIYCKLWYVSTYYGDIDDGYCGGVQVIRPVIHYGEFEDGQCATSLPTNAEVMTYNGREYAVIITETGKGVSCETARDRCPSGYDQPDVLFSSQIISKKGLTFACSSTQCDYGSLFCSTKYGCSCQDSASSYTSPNICVKRLCPNAPDTCPNGQYTSCGSNTNKVAASKTPAGTQCYTCNCIAKHFKSTKYPNSCLACIPSCSVSAAKSSIWYDTQPLALDVVHRIGSTGETTAPCNTKGLNTLARPTICNSDDVCFICGKR